MHEQHDGGERADANNAAGAVLDRTFRLDRQIDGAVCGQHRHRNQTAQNAERIEQLEQPAALVQHAQVAIDAERHALQNVAERHAEHQRRHEAAGKQRVIPERAPACILDLVAELEADRPQDQGRQHQEHGDVEARKRRRINRRERGEDGAAAGDQPHLVAVPDRPDRVDRHAPLAVVARHERQQGRDAEIEAVHDGEADQQHAEEQPPDYAKDFIVDGNVHDDVSFTAQPCRTPASAPRRAPQPAPCARISASGSDRRPPATSRTG